MSNCIFGAICTRKHQMVKFSYQQERWTWKFQEASIHEYFGYHERPAQEHMKTCLCHGTLHAKMCENAVVCGECHVCAWLPCAGLEHTSSSKSSSNLPSSSSPNWEGSLRIPNWSFSTRVSVRMLLAWCEIFSDFRRSSCQAQQKQRELWATCIFSVEWIPASNICNKVCATSVRPDQSSFHYLIRTEHLRDVSANEYINAQIGEVAGACDFEFTHKSCLQIVELHLQNNWDWPNSWINGFRALGSPQHAWRIIICCSCTAVLAVETKPLEPSQLEVLMILQVALLHLQGMKKSPLSLTRITYLSLLHQILANSP